MAIGCAVISCCVEGCILIPCGWECESEKVVADRKDESGQTEKIIHKKMHLNLFVLGLNPEGGLFGTTHFLYSRFDCRTSDDSSEIWPFGHFPMLQYDQWPYVKNIPGTDRWAYSNNEILSAEDVKLRLRIWAKKDGLVYDCEFDAVDRYKSWEVTDRVEWIQVNDRKGKVLVNVITGDEVRSEKKPPNESSSNHRCGIPQSAPGGGKRKE